jgi:glycosyltransferase involved in cell wall biosynthesis
VDDGSTDDIKSKLYDYINEGAIKYYYQSNSGVSEARNKGASISEGQYLIFLDSDDSVTENWLLDYAIMIKKSESDIFELKSYYSIAKSELAIKQYNDIITFLRFELTQTPNVRNRNQRNHMMVEAMRMVNIHDRMLEKLNTAFDIYLVDELKPDKYKSTIYDNLFRYINKNLVSPADQLYRFIQLNIRNNTSDYNRTFIQRYLIKCEIDLSVMLDSKNEDLVNWKTKMYRIFRKFFNENNTSVSSISSID